MIKSDMRNGLSLIAIQAANALFPLLVFPYLLFVLEKEVFAILVLAEAISFYVLTVSLYSFDTKGVQAIIEAREIGGKESEAACFYNIFSARILLFFVSSIVLVALNYFIINIRLDILMIWLLFALGMVLQSNFYFQAIERNLTLAFYVVASRIGAMLAIYYFVHNREDLLMASAILAGSYLASGMAAFTELVICFGVKALRFMSWKEISLLLTDGRHLFIGNISVALFRGANILILSGVSNATAVSIYALSEKSIKSVQALARPLTQVYAPKAIRSWASLEPSRKNKSTALNIVWRSTRLQLLLMSLVLPVFVLALFVGGLCGLLPGFNTDVIRLIAFMAPAVIFGVANSMFGAIGLNLISEQRYFARTVFYVGAFAFALSFLMSYFLGELGAGLTYVLAELSLLILFVYRYKEPKGSL